MKRYEYKYEKLYDIIYWGRRYDDSTDKIYKKILRNYKLEEKLPKHTQS